MSYLHQNETRASTVEGEVEMTLIKGVITVEEENLEKTERKLPPSNEASKSPLSEGNVECVLLVTHPVWVASFFPPLVLMCRAFKHGTLAWE